MGNRLFTMPGTVNTAPTTHSQRDDDCHGNGEVVESNIDVQREMVMSGFRNAVVESHSGRRTWGSNKVEKSQDGTRTKTNESETVKTDGWTTEPGEVSPTSVATDEPKKRYDQLLSPPKMETGDLSGSTMLPHQVHVYSRVGEGGRNPYQTLELFSPYWLIDSAYGTRLTFNTALSCPEDPQTRVTDERPVVSFANDDVVIPPSGTVDPTKVEDEDTTEEIYYDAFDDFITASHTYRTSADARPDRRMSPRRRDMVVKPVDGKIAIGAHSDGLPIGSSIRACSDRRISGGVSLRIERAEFSPDCSFCLTDKKPHVLRRPPQRSISRYHLSTKFEEEDNSRKKRARKMFSIEKSNDDEVGYLSYRCGTRSPSCIIRRRHASKPREKQYFTNTSYLSKSFSSVCQLEPHHKLGKQPSRGVSPRTKRAEFPPNCLLCLSDTVRSYTFPAVHEHRRLTKCQKKADFRHELLKEAKSHILKNRQPDDHGLTVLWVYPKEARAASIVANAHPPSHSHSTPIIISSITHISRKRVPHRIISILRTKKVLILAFGKLHCQNVSSYRYRRTRIAVRISKETVKRKVCHQVAVIEVAETKSPSHNISHTIAQILPWTMVVMGKVYFLGLILKQKTR